MKGERNEAGFSLIELMVAIGILTTVMGIAFSLLNGFQQAYRYEEAHAEAQRNARFAISRVVEIVRSAGTNPTSNTTVNAEPFLIFLDSSGSPITTAGEVKSSALRLKSDFDGDGLFTTRVSSNTDVIVTSEDVTLKRVSDQLVLIDNTITGGVQVPIAENVSDIVFKDPDGSRRSLELFLEARPTGIAESDPRYRRVSYVSNIRLRNR